MGIYGGVRIDAGRRFAAEEGEGGVASDEKSLPGGPFHARREVTHW